jgi:hypothetical protein
MSRWVHFSIYHSAISFPFLPLISADHPWACDISDGASGKRLDLARLDFNIA